MALGTAEDRKITKDVDNKNGFRKIRKEVIIRGPFIMIKCMHSCNETPHTSFKLMTFKTSLFFF
jgi:hypothetical protein